MIPLRDRLPTRRPPYVTWLLVVGNVVAFVYERLLSPANADAFLVANGFVSARFLANPAGDAVTIVSSMFLHAGWLHLLGNMLFLWIFGDNIEDTLGHLRYLGFYLLTGFVAALSQLAIAPDATAPMVGASGAIAGVLGAYALLYPRARVLTLVPVFVFLQLIELPAWVVLGEWFLLQLATGFFTVAPGRPALDAGVAVFAHLGGFVAGMGLVGIFTRKRPQRAATTWRGSGPRQRVFAPRTKPFRE